MTRQNESVDYASSEPKAYEIAFRPEQGTMFVIKHFERWYLPGPDDVCYDPYKSPLDAIKDKMPTGGRTLEELPRA